MIMMFIGAFLGDFDAALSNFGLEQLIDFVTWSRLVNNIFLLIISRTFLLI